MTDVGKLLSRRSRPGRIASGSSEGRPRASFGCGVCSAATFGRHRGLPLHEAVPGCEGGSMGRLSCPQHQHVGGTHVQMSSVTFSVSGVQK